MVDLSIVFCKKTFTRLKWDKGGKAGFGDGTMSWTNHTIHNAADPFIVSFERGETSISPIKFHFWVKLSRKHFKPTVMEYTYNLAFIDTSQTIELPSFSNCSIGISGVKTRIRMFDVHYSGCRLQKLKMSKKSPATVEASKPGSYVYVCLFLAELW